MSLAGLTPPQGFLLRCGVAAAGDPAEASWPELLAISRPTATRAPDDGTGREEAGHIAGHRLWMVAAWGRGASPTAGAAKLQVPLTRASAAVTARIKRVIWRCAWIARRSLPAYAIIAC